MIIVDIVAVVYGPQPGNVNALSLAGLLYVLDGVAASEGRPIFTTKNHLAKLGFALSHPWRMDVWVEVKNAMRLQDEQFFRNSFRARRRRRSCRRTGLRWNQVDDAQGGRTGRSPPPSTPLPSQTASAFPTTPVPEPASPEEERVLAAEESNAKLAALAGTFAESGLMKSPASCCRVVSVFSFGDL